MSEGTLSRYSSYGSSSGFAPSLSTTSVTGQSQPVLVVTDPTGKATGGNARNNTLPPLPSSRYCHSRWYDLRENDVKGDMLRAPRIREGPVKGDRQYRKPPEDVNVVEDPDNRRLKRRNFRNEMENWENTTCANLSFQDLGDDFQHGHFLKTLRRLIRCERLQLLDNSLTDLSSVSLPQCTHLYLQGNSLHSFKQLPRTPALKHLTLSNNGIETLSGISVLRKTPIESLILSGNHCTFQENYRRKIFKELPSLKRLDGTPKLPKDTSEDDETKSATCVIS